MWRACVIVKYNERSLKYFKALFADIFNQKRKKMHYLQTERLAMTSCVTSAQLFALNFWSKIARALFKLDALIFAGQKRQLEKMTYEDKAFT